MFRKELHLIFFELLPWNQNFSVRIKVLSKLVTIAAEKIPGTPFTFQHNKLKFGTQI